MNAKKETDKNFPVFYILWMNKRGYKRPNGSLDIHTTHSDRSEKKTRGLFNDYSKAGYPCRLVKVMAREMEAIDFSYSKEINRCVVQFGERETLKESPSYKKILKAYHVEKCERVITSLESQLAAKREELEKLRSE